MSKQKKIILTTCIILFFVLFITFSILFSVTENKAYSIAYHVLFSIFKIPTALYILYKIFKKTIGLNIRKFITVCGVGLVVSAVFEVARIFKDGPEHAGVLFFPLSIPIAFWAAIYYSKGSNEEINHQRTAYYICVPLLILSLYFETYFLFN